MKIGDNHPYIKELYKKYNQDSFSHYIELNNYYFLKETNDKLYFQNKKNPNLILKIVRNLFDDYICCLLYSKDGNIGNKLEYYKGIPNVFYYNGSFFKKTGKIEEVNWYIKDLILYNANGPSSIRYFQDGKFSIVEWTNKEGVRSNVEFASFLLRQRSNKDFIAHYKINGIHVSEKELKNMIDTVKSGKIIRNINKYLIPRKLQAYKEIAEYYNLTEAIEAIENRLLVFKLEGKI